MPPAADSSLLLTLLAGGFVTAFLHAALPTHWLPFVLVGRAQGWRLAMVLLAVAVAGLAHIASTALIGALIVGLGLALDPWLDGHLQTLAAAVLFALGGWYLWRAWRHPPERDPVKKGREGDPAGQRPLVRDRAAFAGLVLALAVTPGEVLLPFYLSQAGAGLPTLAGLTMAFGIGTVLGMAVFTCLAWFGWSIFRLERWARFEGAALGLALIAVGLLVLLMRH